MIFHGQIVSSNLISLPLAFFAQTVNCSLKLLSIFKAANFEPTDADILNQPTQPRKQTYTQILSYSPLQSE
jgi:hypothetical protein